MSIQWINDKMSNLFGVTPLIFLISLISFNGTPKVDVQKLSGEEIFRSVFFGEGELAEAVPELKEINLNNYTKDVERLKQAEDFQDKVVTTIQQKYPAYMPSLKKAMISKDRVQISKAVIKGRNYLQEVVWDIDGRVDQQTRDKVMRDLKAKVKSGDLSSDDKQNLLDDYAEQVSTESNRADAVACVAIVLIILLAIVLVIPLMEDGDTLSHEQKIDGIAGAL